LKLICNSFALKSSPEGEDLDGDAFDFALKAPPSQPSPSWGRRQAIESIR
jgi:hypothetical protein